MRRLLRGGRGAPRGWQVAAWSIVDRVAGRAAAVNVRRAHPNPASHVFGMARAGTPPGARHCCHTGSTQDRALKGPETPATTGREATGTQRRPIFEDLIQPTCDAGGLFGIADNRCFDLEETKHGRARSLHRHHRRGPTSSPDSASCRQQHAPAAGLEPDHQRGGAPGRWVSVAEVNAAVAALRRSFPGLGRHAADPPRA